VICHLRSNILTTISPVSAVLQKLEETTTFKDLKSQLPIVVYNDEPPNFNLFKPIFLFTVFKETVRTSKRTPNFTIRNTNWLVLFKEIIVIYDEKQRKS
jgi:hypothetical protein